MELEHSLLDMLNGVGFQDVHKCSKWHVDSCGMGNCEGKVK